MGEELIEKVVTSTIPENSVVIENQTKVDKEKKKFHLRWLCFIISIIGIILIIYLLKTTINRAGEATQEAYNKAKDNAITEAYNKFYDTAFESAERKYHASNRVSIEIGEIQEKSNLEVLRVSDVEYVIETTEDNDDDIECWLEVYGDGIFTVDMKESEFICDPDRQYVLVTVPKPVLYTCEITDVNELHWKNGIFNKSISVGEELAKNMRKEGLTKLKNYMSSNTRFYKNAKESAELVISEFVRGLNPELENLVVEVEFIE